MPIGQWHIGVDPLSAVFLIPIFFLSVLAAVYSVGYFRSAPAAKSRGWTCFCFLTLVGSMCVVVCARDAVLFLLAWEVMALSSFFLVVFDSGREEVRRAGWTYLVATHIGTAFIIVLFTWMGRTAGSFDFDRWENISFLPGARAGIWFVLALIGFGVKAGFWPLHVWLPDAHPAAPSPVSAILSGVMIKTGIYGLLRVLLFLGPPPAWWGTALLAVGAVTGVIGALFALSQRDLKRILAYSSVENIGIVTIGLGAGLLAMSFSAPAAAVLGFAGALLHVLNHAIFKGLLFFCAGSVQHETGTRDIEKLGGLMKKNPLTGMCFLTGSAAICGLPPLNGFVGEWLIYAALFKLSLLGGVAGIVSIVSIVSLALIGALALACFSGVFGVVFLGESRSSVSNEHPPLPKSMGWPMALLAMACVVLGLLPSAAFMIELPAALQITSAAMTEGMFDSVLSIFQRLTAGIWLLIGIGLAVRAFGKCLASRVPAAPRTVTWDCGYSRPTAKMQYTAGSFVEPLTQLFRTILLTKILQRPPVGYFPSGASFVSRTPDIARAHLFSPFFEWAIRQASRMMWIQQGRIQTYLLYIFITLAALLAYHFARR